MKYFGKLAVGFAAIAALVLIGLAGTAAEAQAKKYKIYLSMSFIGNDWQAENANMTKAMAQHKNYRDKVDLKIMVAGPNAQKQNQQINAMVQAGADAIVVFPISPTALNKSIKNACDRGVFVVSYAADVTEPCAYIVTINEKEVGPVTAQWLVDALGAKGRIAMVTGVPGTSVDTDRTEGAKAVFSKNPGIEIVAEVNGMWSQAVARAELAKVIATHGWDGIDGLWMQAGCFSATAMQIEAGIADDKLRPCAGEASNGHRIQMLPVGTVEGQGAYRSVALRSISYGSPLYSGALSLKTAVRLLEGEDVPHLITLPLPLSTSAEIKLCEEGTWAEMAAGCNVFPPSLVPPGWFADIYGAQTPEVGFAAALVGEPED